MFTRIVVGYDDSPGARLALHAAIELAEARNGRVTVVAVEAHLSHYGATVGEVEEEREVEERACRRWLKAAEAYAAEHGIEIRTASTRVVTESSRGLISHSPLLWLDN